MKTYIASDFHIGFEQSNYPKIKEFFELVKDDADRLILVGDIFDLWRCSPDIIRNYEPFKSIYKSLLNLAKTIPVIIIKGNHDYNLNKKLNLPNIKVVNNFTEDNIYFTHGWEFDLQQRKASKYYYWIVKYFPYLYQNFFKLPSKIIKKEDQIYNNSKIYDEVQKFRTHYFYKYIVMGHTHNPMINNRIVDCGDFIDSCSYVIIEDSNITLHYL